jgi:hypothetical protein
MSEWKGRFIGFARATDNTADNRQALAEIFANNGSLETVENERACFDSVTRYSVSGEMPAQMMGINTLIKVAMWNPIRSLWEETLTDGRYFVVANVDVTYQGTLYKAGELVETNSAFATPGQPCTYEDAVTAINAERTAALKAPLVLLQEPVDAEALGESATRIIDNLD